MRDPNNEEHQRKASGQESPFDGARRTNDAGEYWSARDLMPLMGYKRWQTFEIPLQRAMRTAANTDLDIHRHFKQASYGPFSGRTVEPDVHLSRHAANLVAMNGDPNKPEVAAAQTYFAAKSREADLAEREFNDLPEWARQQIKTIHRVGKIEAEQVHQGQRITDVEHRIDGIEGRHDWYSALAYAKKMRLPTSKQATQALGRAASRLCRSRSITPEKTTHELYGEVNLYPEVVLAEASRGLREAG